MKRIIKPTENETEEFQRGLEPTNILDMDGNPIYRDKDALVVPVEVVPYTPSGLAGELGITVLERDAVWEPEYKKISTGYGKALKIGLAALAAFAAVSPMLANTAYADVNGNIKYIQPENSGNSYVELNAFYGLLGDIEGYTFVDFSDGSYFAKTALEKKIRKGFNARAQIVHANELFTQAGLGVGIAIPDMPKGRDGKIRFMPLWFDKDGEVVKDKVIIGYSFETNLPKGFKLSSVGEWNVANGEWAYGELELGKKINQLVKIGYNAALIGDGDAIPDLEHRVFVEIDF